MTMISSIGLTLIVSNNLWDIQEPTYRSKREGDVVPGVVVYVHF